MRNLLAVTLFVTLLPMTAHSYVMSFSCKSAQLPGIHKFDASGIVTVDDKFQVEGIVTVTTEKSDSAQSMQAFDEVRVKGFMRHFSAGDLTVNSFDQLVLTTSEAYLKSMNLLLGYNGNIASRVLSVDNFSYRSNCKITETFN